MFLITSIYLYATLTQTLSSFCYMLHLEVTLLYKDFAQVFDNFYCMPSTLTT